MASKFSIQGVITLDSAALRRGSAQANKSLRSIQTTASSVTSTLSTMVAAMGVATGVSSGIRAMAQFESRLAQARVAGKATAEEFARLNEIALDLGDNPLFTATDKAGALKFLTKAGLDAQQSFRALAPTLYYAAAGEIEMSDAADQLTDILGGMGGTVNDLKNYTDLMAEGSTHATVSMSELAESFRKVAPMARQSHTTFKEVTQMLVYMAQGGIRAEEAGTALSMSFNRLAQGSSEVVKGLASVGISFKDIQNAINQGGMAQALQLVKQGFDTLGDDSAKKLDYLGKVFGRHGKSMALILGQSAEEANELSLALDNSAGAAQRMAEAGIGDFDKSMRGLQATFENIAIQMTKTSDGLDLTDAINGLTEILKIIGTVNDKVGLLNLAFGLMATKYIAKPIASTRALGNATKVLDQAKLRVANLQKQYLTLNAQLKELKVTGAKASQAQITSLQNLKAELVSAKSEVRTAKKDVTSFRTAGVKTFKDLKAGAMSFGKSLASMTLYTAAFTALFEAVGYMTDLYKSAVATKNAIKSFNTELVVEQKQLETLYSSLSKASEGTHNRQSLIDTFNKKYGEYLQNLLSEKSTIEEITKAYDAANKAIKTKLISKIIDPQIIEEQEKQLKDLKETFEDVGAGAVGTFLDLYDQLKKTKGGVEAVSDVYTGLGQDQRMVNKYTDRLRDTGGQLVQQLRGQGLSYKDILVALREYNNYQKKIEELESIKKKRIEQTIESQKKSTLIQKKESDGVSDYIQDLQKLIDVQNRLFSEGEISRDDLSKAIIAIYDKAIETVITKQTELKDKAGKSYELLLPDIARLTQILKNKRAELLLPTDVTISPESIDIDESGLNEEVEKLEIIDTIPAKFKIDTTGVTFENLGLKIVQRKIENEIKVLYSNIDKALKDDGSIDYDAISNIYDNIINKTSQLNALSTAIDFGSSSFTDRFMTGFETIATGVDGVVSMSDAISDLNSKIEEGDATFADYWNVFAQGVETVANTIQAVTQLTSLIKALSVANTIATKQQIANSTAKNAANTGEAITGATASGAKMPFPYNLIAIGTGVAAVLAAVAGIAGAGGKGSSTPKVPNLGNIGTGGNVDMIRANEYRRNVIGVGSNEIKITGRLVADGDELAAVLERTDKRNNTY